MGLNPEIWGKWYWGFLHTIAFTYPNYPNSVTKKKYYELIQSFPLFIPVESMSSNFHKLLQSYPVAPYLDNRESFIKWVHYIHNKINEQLEKPQIPLKDFYIHYYENYKPAKVKITYYHKLKQKIIYLLLLLLLLFSIYYLYDK
jgi:hypothetical protein